MIELKLTFATFGEAAEAMMRLSGPQILAEVTTVFADGLKPEPEIDANATRIPGQPAPGKQRRTKAEIAEDDALVAAATGEKPNISATPEDRQDPKNPEPRYFYHPESSSLTTTTDGSYPDSDGHLEEIDEAQYRDIEAKLKAAADDKPKLTKQDAKDALAKVLRKVGQDDCRQFLKNFGFDRLGDVPEDRFADLIAKCEAKVAA